MMENDDLYLWWLGWNTSPVANREGAVGSQLGEGDHWILLDRRRLHHLFTPSRKRC
jgi:hypothetical protein